MRRLFTLTLTLACETQLSEPVRADQLANVSITPKLDTLDAIGANRLLGVALRDANGNAVSGATIFWASTDPSIAAIDQSGRVTARKAGRAKIVATAADRSDHSDIVIFQRVALIGVNPTTATVAPGSTTELVATAYDATGHPIIGRPVSWSSSNTAVATVSAAGVVQAVTTGSATIRASSGGVTGTSSVSVLTATPTPTPTPTPVDTVFYDGFESGTLGAWHDGVNAAKHRVVTDAAQAADGSRFLEITYPAGGDGGWLTRFFMPGYDSIYVRYDVQFESSWQGGTKLLNLRGSPVGNQWGAFGVAGTCPTGLDFFAANVVMLSGDNPGPARFYSYFPAMLPELSGVCWGRLTGEGTTTYTDGPAMTRGVWHRVEFFVKLNTPGAKNGVQRLWIDGTLRGVWTGLAFRLTDVLKLNSLTLEGSLMGGPVGSTRRLHVDNVLVARTRP